MEKEKIKFKPLHEGMGFHPFSDGLPYAPESKASTTTVPKTSITPATKQIPPKSPSMGTGAMAAGRPQFATARQLKQLQDQITAPPSVFIPSLGPSTPAPATRSPQAPSPAPKIISTTINPSINPSINPGYRAKAPSPAPAAKPAVDPSQTTAILRRRTFAYLLDTVIHAGFWLATNLTALFFFNFQVDAQVVQDHLSQFLIFFLVSQWLFIALQEMLFETSIGKAFFNLEFKRNHSSLFLRSIVFMIGVMAFGLGLYYRPHDRLGQLQLKTKIYS